MGAADAVSRLSAWTHMENSRRMIASATSTDTKDTATPLRLIRLLEVMDRTGLSRPTIYKAMATARFPASVKFGSATMWAAHEVELWIQERINEARERNARTRA